MFVFVTMQVLTTGMAMPIIRMNLDILYSKLLGDIKQVRPGWHRHWSPDSDGISTKSGRNARIVFCHPNPVGHVRRAHLHQVPSLIHC